MLIDDGLLRSEDEHWEAVGDLSEVPRAAVDPAPARDASRPARGRRAARARAGGGRGQRLPPRRGRGARLGRGASPASPRASPRLVRKELIAPVPGDVRGRGRVRVPAPVDPRRGVRRAAEAGSRRPARRYVAWLESRAGEVEELLGYHLEQAFRYRSELGTISAHDAELGARASRPARPPRARRALARGDMSAAVELLDRALALRDDESGLESCPSSGPPSGSRASSPAPRKCSPRCRSGRGGRGSPGSRSPGSSSAQRSSSSAIPSETDELLEEIEACRRGARRARRRSCARRRVDADRAALRPLEGAGRPWRGVVEPSARTCPSRRRPAAGGDDPGTARLRGLVGPTPVSERSRVCEAILAESGGDPLIDASVARYLAPLEARLGRFTRGARVRRRARAIVRGVRHALLGRPRPPSPTATSRCSPGDYEAAERELRKGWLALEEIGERGYSSSVAAFLGRALYAQGRLDEAEEIALHAQERAAPDDLWSQALALGTRAKVLARRGSHAEGELLAREAVARVEPRTRSTSTGRRCSTSPRCSCWPGWTPTRRRARRLRSSSSSGRGTRSRRPRARGARARRRAALPGPRKTEAVEHREIDARQARSAGT